MKDDILRTNRLQSEDPVTTYLHARYGRLPDDVREIAEQIDIEYTQHFWPYSTSYPDAKNNGDLSTLQPFTQYIEEFSRDHPVYSVDIGVEACEKGLYHDAWILYGCGEAGYEADLGFLSKHEPWQDSFFDVDVELGLVDGFNLELVGWYSRRSEQYDRGKTPLDRILPRIDELAEDHTILDIQTDTALGSGGGLYRDAWVFYREVDEE